MNEKTERKIWQMRLQGMTTQHIAHMFRIPEKEVREILDKAPNDYKRRYNQASRIREGDFTAFPPKAKNSR